MAYLWGRRFTMKMTPLVAALREEIYVEPYESIDWKPQRNNVNPVDNYSPHHPVFDTLNVLLKYYEQMPYLTCLPSLRKMGLKAAYNQIVYEDENTDYQTVGPVSKAFNMLARLDHDGPDSDAVKQHLTKIDDFLWMSKEGMFMTGTNGSQLWDISFLAQAEVETGLALEANNKESVLKMLDWLDKCQIRHNPKWHKEGYRQSSKGAWPFSTPQQSYTVSDCTAEGMKAVMALQSLPGVPTAVTVDRLRDSVDVLLSMQNKSGGFASYELTRGSSKMEWLNAAEVFGNIMIDYQYPECTTSVLSALKHFTKIDPSYRSAEIS
jgi:lanosterol synthase